MEGVGGKLGLLGLGFSGSMTPFHTMTEIGDVKKANMELKQLKKSMSKSKIDEKRGEMKEFIQQRPQGLEHALHSVRYYYAGISLMIYDLHIVKSILREMFQQDGRLKRRGIPPVIGQKLEQGIQHTKQQINDELRKVSDMLGALTQE
jgi:hypothetical protein|tara:strand:- start:1051 stop:1494 length:444 start_codon:yes stop_codon:yes gene_type:complete